MKWIPCTLNQKADYYSKIVDFDDWCVSNDYFREIYCRWGPFPVDCCPSYANTKLPRFYSRFYSPNTLGVDALSHRWEGENCWLLSPVSLVTQVIEHFKLCKWVGTLVVSYWLSAIFWLFIINKDRSFRSYILDFLYVCGSALSSFYEPFIFTNVMLTLIKHWRSQAIRILVYLDDGLGVYGSKDTCL